jgi:probable F420-dependent oxidoreductase
MGEHRPFRFGVTAGRVESARAWRDLARRTEGLGYSTLFMSDHFNDQLAPIPALAAAAEATERLRIGTLVLDNDFRNPAMAAKELATLDLLSDGRLEWGMGAGWFPFDYESTGIPFDGGAVRAARLGQAVTIMKGLFADGPVTHKSDEYEITELEGTPKPVQSPHPPLLIGAARRRMLSLAGRHADIVGVAPSLDSRPFGSRPALMSVSEATDRQVGWIRDGAGTRFDGIELQMVAFPASVGGDTTRQVDNLAQAWGIDPSEVQASPHVLIGSVDEICDGLEHRRARWGVSYWVVASAVVDAFAPVVDQLHDR